ncbi:MULTISPECIES: hypothetical protein [unclassified Cryobacterium]|uniref:hypothetical protein n=1 Tax=unclassified Cryobacterium TaxID=2649013 RepID=UPI0018E0BB97|nr:MULTISPECIES: hypothetical protein [unclassified Cryobacterium]
MMPTQSTWSGLTVIPIALWEFLLGVYLVVKGFKPSPITAGMTDAATPRLLDASL